MEIFNIEKTTAGNIDARKGGKKKLLNSDFNFFH